MKTSAENIKPPMTLRYLTEVVMTSTGCAYLTSIYLSCRAERMSKVDANHGTSVQVDHVVGLMPVTNAQQVVTDAQLRVSPRKVHSQTVESFGTGAHLLIGTATITTSSNTIQAHIHIV